MSVEKLLRQVPGVNATPVLPWIIAQGLSSVGISDLEQARQWLVQTFNAETELQDKKSTLVRDSVALEARSTALAHAQNALTMLTLDFVDIAPRVERFAEAWVSAHQDIRFLATGVRAGKVDIKKNFSTRVKDVGEACRAVRRAMEDYYWDVEVTGVLKNGPPEVLVTLKSKL
ncbi:hypothetical protein H0H81_000434 [Sphagnurus paluster]|uniref:Uncharacterized protein n=1 Tax=Sphagnurus paluster TaxID=117069 RepID=A0A9P7GML0_9AGAR|nr:hypothetical protein H0H81_000434 [Sphagnurus paluster]